MRIVYFGRIHNYAVGFWKAQIAEEASFPILINIRSDVFADPGQCYERWMNLRMVAAHALMAGTFRHDLIERALPWQKKLGYYDGEIRVPPP